MPRPEKVQAVADIRARIERAQAVFIAEYAGLSVKEQQELRRGLRAAGGEFRVVKMTLARLAVEEMGRFGLDDLLAGPAGLAYAYDDPAATARSLRDFARDHARLLVKGALFGSEVLPPEQVAALADLEPRPVLLARVAGALQAPVARMAGLLAALPRGMATALSGLIDKKPAPAAAPEAAPAAEAAPVPEAAPEAVPAAEAAPGPEAAPEAVPEAAPEAAPSPEAGAAEASAMETEPPGSDSEPPGSEAEQAAAPPAEEAATNEADQAEEE
jgi:large subunit ribosomal protein L10